jgi:hypothetical protein
VKLGEFLNFVLLCVKNIIANNFLLNSSSLRLTRLKYHFVGSLKEAFMALTVLKKRYLCNVRSLPTEDYEQLGEALHKRSY